MSRTESDGTPSPPASPPEPGQASSASIPEKAAAPQAELTPPTSGPASEPKQEMTLSESTLVWMVEGEARETDPSRVSSYDFHAPADARRRVFALVGIAGGVALIIAFVLHLVAASRPPAPDETEDAASQLTRRAELALAQGRSGEAIELAHLAIAANSRVPGAYAVVGAVARTAGRVVEARTAYTKYLELAPVGPHAAEARAALAVLPP